MSALENRPSSLRSLELFTGAGGLALGTHLAGFHHAALLEWNRDACETLRTNAMAGAVPGIEEWRVLQGDVRAVAFEEFGLVDLVAGGPPCQPFSIAGKHQGMDDSRNMIPEFIRAIRALTPRAFILENVKGLQRPGFQSYYSYIRLQLTYPTVVRRSGEDWPDHLRRLEDIHTSGRFEDLRYNVVDELLNAADYGVPQVRERVFLVGFRSDTGIRWHFPEAEYSRRALLYQQWVTGEYWARNGLKQPDEPYMRTQQWRQRPIEGGLFPRKPWRTVREAIKGLPEPYEGGEVAAVTNHRLIPGARPYVGHTGSPMDWPAKTLKAGDHGVPGGENMVAFRDGSVRHFTVREAARLQTVPDTWHFQGAWSEAMRQLGNAVPVELAHAVARSVAVALGRGDGRASGVGHPPPADACFGRGGDPASSTFCGQPARRRGVIWRQSSRRSTGIRV